MHFTLLCAVRMQAHYGGSLNDAAVPHLVDRPRSLVYGTTIGMGCIYYS
jgi:hypothetical protein